MAAKNREERLERRIDRFEKIYNDIVDYSTELVHYLESHSGYNYEGPLEASDLALEDAEAEKNIFDTLELLENKRTSYEQMKGLLEDQLTRENDPELRARFERKRWESERYIHHRIEPVKEDLEFNSKSKAAE